MVFWEGAGQLIPSDVALSKAKEQEKSVVSGLDVYETRFYAPFGMLVTVVRAKGGGKR